jgi:5-methylcytosine-specific restriction protein A
MKFGRLQLSYFRATEGAYSIVTGDERDNSQITLTEADGEAAIAIQALGRTNIPRGAARGRTSTVMVRRPDGSEEPGELTINFPKATGDELRVYRNAKTGFNYEAGDVWFIYRRRGRRLFVGAMKESAWRALGRQDVEDERYVELAEESLIALPDPSRVQALRYRRDPQLALRAFRRSNFQCEFDPRHRLFVSRVSGHPFLEPHHLVHVSLQSQFQKRLDHPDNIFALCPWCHRAVHHAETGLVTNILDTLLKKRRDLYRRLGQSRLDILRLYNCENIARGEPT